MSEKINKETLENLLALSRIELREPRRPKGSGFRPQASEEKMEPKLLRDLQRILEHFEELKEVDTGGVDLIEGGKAGLNEYRKDEERSDFRKEDSTKQFPETQGGYLKVPAILERKKGKKDDEN